MWSGGREGSLYQLDQQPMVPSGIHEGDEMTPAPRPRVVVDEPDAPLFEIVEGGFEVRDLVRDVVEALAAPGQEPADDGVGPRRAEQLEEGVSERQHHLVDALIVHAFSMHGLDPPDVAVMGDGRVEVVNRQRDVFDPFEHGSRHPSRVALVPGSSVHVSISNARRGNVAGNEVEGGVVKVIELVGSSPSSFSDAVRNAVRVAGETIRNIRGVEVLQSNATVGDNGEIENYKVNVKIAFLIVRGGKVG